MQRKHRGKGNQGRYHNEGDQHRWRKKNDIQRRFMFERLMLDLPHGQINKARRHNFYFTKKDYKFLIKVF